MLKHFVPNLIVIIANAWSLILGYQLTNCGVLCTPALFESGFVSSLVFILLRQF